MKHYFLLKYCSGLGILYCPVPLVLSFSTRGETLQEHKKRPSKDDPSSRKAPDGNIRVAKNIYQELNVNQSILKSFFQVYIPFGYQEFEVNQSNFSLPNSHID